MIEYKNNRLSLSSILIFCHCDPNAKPAKKYLHLLPRELGNLSKKQIEALLRDGYEIAVGLGLFTRHIRKGVAGGYVYKITKKGQARYDDFNNPDYLTDNLKFAEML